MYLIIMYCPNFGKIGQITILLTLLTLKSVAVDPASFQPIPNVVQASKILGDIENGVGVNVSNAVVIGDLSVSRLKLPAINSDLVRDFNLSSANDLILIGVPVRIAESEIQGKVDFSNVLFSNSTEFTGNVFEKEANFEETHFAKPAHFRASQFEDNAIFLSDKFIDGADFGESQFNGIAYFSGAQFCNYASFRDVKFKGDGQLSGIHFCNDAYFSDTQFDEDCYFGGTRFEKNAYFKVAQFHFVNFEKSQFSGYVGFAEAKFYDNTYFRGVQFCGISDFSDAEFYEDAHFEEAQFEASFDLSRSKFDRLYVFWNDIDEVLVYDGSTYLSLIRNFKNQELFNDADECYYKYRRISQANKNFGWSKVGDILAWLSCGYGVHPGYTLIWCMAFIILFGIIIWAGNGVQIDVDHDHSRSFSSLGYNFNYSKRIRKKQSEITSISLLDSIYFSALIFFHTLHPSSWRPSKRWSLWLILFEDIVGWLLLALFLVALANVIIR